MMIVDLGDQDGLRFESAMELVEHARACATLVKGFALGKAGAVVMGLGQGVRIAVGPGAGRRDRRKEAGNDD